MQGRDSDAQRFVAALDVTLELPVAQVATRTLSAVIDYLVLALVWMALLSLAVAAHMTLNLPSSAVLVYLIGSFLLQWFFFVAIELATGGQTPGKRALGLRAVREDGTSIGALASIVRNVLRPADFLVGPFVMFASHKGRRLGDFAAGTVVIREDVDQGGPERTWPRGMAAEDLSLMQTWFRRQHALRPHRRELIADEILQWVTARYPSLTSPSGAQGAAALEHLFAPATEVRTDA